MAYAAGIRGKPLPLVLAEGFGGGLRGARDAEGSTLLGIFGSILFKRSRLSLWGVAVKF